MSTSPPASPAAPRPFFNPYFTIGVSVVLDAAAQVLLKVGADQSITPGHFGLQLLHSGWGWLGIFALVSSLGSWLYSLRFVPLNIAANLTACVHALVPLASWFFLGEKISLLRWAGIGLVIVGVFIVARPLMRVEQEVEEKL